MPMLRRDMSVGLLGDEVGRNDFDEDFLEVLLCVFVAKLGQSAFGEKFSIMDDADGVAELFDLAHDVGGENDGFAVVATFANESGNGARGHDIEAVGGFVEELQ